MKKIILSLFVCLFTLFGLSQTPVDVYVINPEGCPYYLTDTYQGPGGTGIMTLLSIDSLVGQNIHHYQINDTVYPITLTIGLFVGVTQPPFIVPPPQYITQIINGPTSITFITICTVTGLEDISQKQRKLLSIKNIIGEEVEELDNQIQIYTYDNGDVEKIFKINQN